MLDRLLWRSRVVVHGYRRVKLGSVFKQRESQSLECLETFVFLLLPSNLICQSFMGRQVWWWCIICYVMATRRVGFGSSQNGESPQEPEPQVLITFSCVFDLPPFWFSAVLLPCLTRALPFLWLTLRLRSFALGARMLGWRTRVIWHSILHLLMRRWSKQAAWLLLHGWMLDLTPTVVYQHWCGTCSRQRRCRRVALHHRWLPLRSRWCWNQRSPFALRRLCLGCRSRSQQHPGSSTRSWPWSWLSHLCRRVGPLRWRRTSLVLLNRYARGRRQLLFRRRFLHAGNSRMPSPRRASPVLTHTFWPPLSGLMPALSVPSRDFVGQSGIWRRAGTCNLSCTLSVPKELVMVWELPRQPHLNLGWWSIWSGYLSICKPTITGLSSFPPSVWSSVWSDSPIFRGPTCSASRAPMSFSGVGKGRQVPGKDSSGRYLVSRGHWIWCLSSTTGSRRSDRCQARAGWNGTTSHLTGTPRFQLLCLSSCECWSPSFRMSWMPPSWRLILFGGSFQPLPVLSTCRTSTSWP